MAWKKFGRQSKGCNRQMNDFEAWQERLSEWKQVNRMKNVNQRLYDYLASSIIYILEYAKKNGIILPHRDVLYRMVERAEENIDIINTISDERIQPSKNRSSDEEEYRALNEGGVCVEAANNLLDKVLTNALPEIRN